jgi:ubiquinone/menaquinone biosynthesis C-methylase UbiE
VTVVSLTSQQQAQADYFDAKYGSSSRTIRLDRYDEPRFGPWSSYWFAYDAVRQARKNEPQRLLTVGCGTGDDALRYANMGYDVEGIDISPRAIALARESADRNQLADQARFSVQPAETLEYEDGSFDVVVGVDVLHHLDAPRAVREASRVLRSGGIAIFREPLATPLRDRIRNTKLVTWLVRPGTKCRRRKIAYGESEGERNLDATDFDVFRQCFRKFELHQWRVLGALSVVIGCRSSLQRLDWMLMSLLPPIRRLGDQAVLIGRK